MGRCLDVMLLDGMGENQGLCSECHLAQLMFEVAAWRSDFPGKVMRGDVLLFLMCRVDFF